MEKVQEELEEAKAEIERLKSNLSDKESIIREMSTSTDSQRDDCSEKVQRLEEEKQLLLQSIDEAIQEGRAKQQKLDALYEESETLKKVVSELQRKCGEGAKEGESPKNRMLEGGNMVDELEEKQRKVQDELKWKVEQFKHLEEAHEKLRNQYQASMIEWEEEKSLLIDEISKLLESQDNVQRAAEELKHQLVMCKQALDNEESKRKRLEEQVAEMRISFERGSNEGFQGKMELECSTAQTDEQEAANLRHTLRMKEMEIKDMEYKANKLVKENKEVLSSLRELQEAQIPRAAPTPASWQKLRGKLKTLEQSHRECAASFKAKEAEWNSRAQIMTQELNRRSSCLQIKDHTIEELKKELQNCKSSLTQLKMQNEELSLMLQLLRSEYSESGSDQQIDREGGLVHLMSQLEKEREEKLAMQNEFDEYKKQMEEAADRERQLREELQEVYDILDNIDSELTDKSYEGSELELKLENWRSIAERLKMQLEESQEKRRELEASLLAQAEVEETFRKEIDDKDKRISNLEQQILLMDQEIRIGEGDDDMEDENLLQQSHQFSRMDDEGNETDEDDDRLHLDLLARELEVAILTHTTEERTKMHQQKSLQVAGCEEERTDLDFDYETSGTSFEVDDLCTAKENENQRSSTTNKTNECIIEERSPFRELN